MDNIEKPQEKPFVHLHVHTEYSLLDGIARIKELPAICKEHGWPAIAMTDHGNMYGTIKFYTECVKKGIKPIIGTEFYLCENHLDKNAKGYFHLILLAKNEEGYHNLIRLNSIAFVDGFYYKPRIDYQLLEKYSGGLICLSACLAGHIPQLLLQNKYDEAKEVALKMKSMFAEGDFYIELQNHGLVEQLQILPDLCRLAKEIGVKTVATNDAHYLRKEDAEVQDVLMCVQMGKQLDDPDRMRFETQEFYLKTYDEMAKALPNNLDALDTTLEIADKCELIIRGKFFDGTGVDKKYVLPANQNYIPAYKPENGMEPYEFLEKLAMDGLKEKYANITPEIMDRLNYELSTIKSQGFVEYFLVVWDYINWARNNGISVGPGRGSGAGSLVAYTTGITQIEPLQYNLIFERFINKERVSMPDFDVDFCVERRQDVVEYTKRKYGASNVANIVTFGTMAAKNSIRDVARVLGMPYSEVDKITKLIPLKPFEGLKAPVLKYYFGTTGDEENNKFIIKELREMYENDPEIHRIADLAIKLEGAPRNTSMHAAGVLIAPTAVSDYVPLARNGEDITTQFDMVELEGLGLLKMDFLGLRTLTDIQKTLEYIKEDKGIDIQLDKIDYTDSKVFDLISSGDCTAIFQLESGGMKKFMTELRPTSIEDIIAGVALYRPGPMDSIPRYIKNKENQDKIVYDLPCLEPILKMTYGCIIYQEQVMQILQEMAGYSLGQADNVRRIMSKKKKDKMALEKEKFINGWEDPEGKKSIPGAIKLGATKEIAEKIFGEMESFASYAFNKSHAAAYAYVTYQTAYLRCYHEVEFICAVLNNRINNSDEIKKYTAYAKEKKIELLPPNINKSKLFFSVEDGNLRYGLCAIKGIGQAVVESIIAEKEANGEYKDFVDLVERLDSKSQNKKVIEGLIYGGALDCFGLTRSTMIANYDQIVQRSKVDRKNAESEQIDMFTSILANDASAHQYKLENLPEYTSRTKLKYEKEVLGAYLSGHPLDDFIDELVLCSHTTQDLKPQEIEDIEDNDEEEKTLVYSVQNGEKITIGGIITSLTRRTIKRDNSNMLTGVIEDLYGTAEFIIFPSMYEKVKDSIKEDDIVKIKGKISIRNDNPPSITVEEIELLQQKIKIDNKIEAPKIEKKLYLKLDLGDKKNLQDIDKIISNHYGIYPVFLVNSADKSTYKYDKNVDLSNNLMRELVALLDENSVKMVETKK